MSSKVKCSLRVMVTQEVKCRAVAYNPGVSKLKIKPLLNIVTIILSVKLKCFTRHGSKVIVLPFVGYSLILSYWINEVVIRDMALHFIKLRSFVWVVDYCTDSHNTDSHNTDNIRKNTFYSSKWKNPQKTRHRLFIHHMFLYYVYVRK